MKFAICTTAKNEPYILEWLTYHLKIGFSYFIIFDDDSDLKISTLFSNSNIDNSVYKIYTRDDIALLEKGFYHYSQYQSYWQKCVIPSLKSKNIDYILQSDIDEFLVLGKFKNIEQLVSHFLPFDALKINWLFFGSNNLMTNTTDSVVKTFNKSSTTFNIHCKSITKVSSIIDIKFAYGSHCLPITEHSITKNILNEIVNPDSNPCFSSLTDNHKNNNIYIAHYFAQDIKTFIKRRFCIKGYNHYWTQLLQIQDIRLILKSQDKLVNNLDELVNLMYLAKNNIDFNNQNMIKCKLKYMLSVFDIDKILNYYELIDTNDEINSDVIKILS